MDTVSKPRVYISNFGGHDFSPAEKWGELQFITRGFISFQSLDRLKFQIAQGILDSSPDDYLLLSGTNIINVVAALLWFELHEKVNILNFDKTMNDYRLITITKSGTTNLMEVLKNG